MAGVLFTHHWQHRTSQIDHTEQVGFHLIAEILRCHLLERSGVAITGVVNQHVEAAKGIEREVDRVLLETRKNVIAVPTTVVQRGAQGLFAWVVSEDDKAVPRKIELGPVSGDLTVITAGLNDGDRVVTDGQYKLQVDAPVAIVTTPTTAENAR